MNKKRLYKIFLVIIAVLAISPWIFTDQSAAKVQAYYSGDAIYYNNQLLVATTNTGYLEIFKLQGQDLLTLVKVKVYNPRFNNYDDYSDVKMTIEGGQLYIYTASKYTLLKYNFSDLRNLSLIAEKKNNSWNWYYRVDRFGNNMGIVGTHGVDILNSDSEIINSYAFSPEEPFGLRSNGSNNLLFAINDDKIQIYNRETRKIDTEIPLNFSSQEVNHKIYFDAITDNIYAIDDYYAKKFSLDGKLLASFRHLDYPGYEMESSTGNPYVYFSNGTGVVKMNKESFTVNDFAYTSNLDGSGGWAMGLKLVNTDKGDRLVVFNSASIIILNDQLDKLASVPATEEARQ